jgi:hypothetical protein
MSFLDISLLYTGDADITMQFGSEHGILYPFHSFRNNIVIIVFMFNYPTSSFFYSLN